MFEVGSYRSCQNDRLEVATFACEFGDRITVSDTGDFLIENRSFVKFFGHVVRSGSDELHAAIVSLAIRVGSDESREKRVVNVDDARTICVDDPRRQDLHVSSQHDQIDAKRGQCVENL